mgnify:CR=1 FL=1
MTSPRDVHVTCVVRVGDSTRLESAAVVCVCVCVEVGLEYRAVWIHEGCE